MTIIAAIHRKYRRFFQVFFLVILLYLLISSYLLFQASVTTTVESVGRLKTAQSLLFTQPQEANRQFIASSQAAEASLSNLRDTPWWSRLLVTLPPFRWQVELAKASHSLATAGTLTSQLITSFPELNPGQTTDPTTLLNMTSSRYLQWFSANESTITQLHTSLAQAQTELEDIPAGSLLTQKENFINLRDHLADTDRTVVAMTGISQSLRRLLGSNDQEEHRFLAYFPTHSTNENSASSYVIITAKKGTITSISFETDAQDLDTTFQKLQNTQDFIGIIGPALGKGYEALVIVRPPVIEQLLEITGTITIPGVAQEKVSQESFQKSPLPAARLLPALSAALSHQPAGLSRLYQVFSTANPRKEAQFWSGDTQLTSILQERTPLDNPPSTEDNWIKIVCPNHRATDTSQQWLAAPWRSQIIYHLTITCDEPGTTSVYLPPSAVILDSHTTDRSSSYQRVSLENGPKYSLTYAVPLNWHTLTTLEYLDTPSETERFEGYGHQGLIEANLLLKRF